MKYLYFAIVVCFILPQKTPAQSSTSDSIQVKIIDGLIYALDQKESSPKDIVIFRTIESKKFYLISSFNGTKIVAKELIPPNLNKIIDSTLEFSKDSIYDVLWIKNRVNFILMC